MVEAGDLKSPCLRVRIPLGAPFFKRIIHMTLEFEEEYGFCPNCKSKDIEKTKNDPPYNYYKCNNPDCLLEWQDYAPVTFVTILKQPLKDEN